MKTLKEIIPQVEELLEWMLEHPEVPAPHSFEILYYFWDDNAKPQMAEMARAFGKGKKEHVGEYFNLRKSFGEDISIRATCDRIKICERKVVGFTDVPETLVPAHRVEHVEWDCGSLLDGEPKELPGSVALPTNEIGVL